MLFGGLGCGLIVCYVFVWFWFEFWGGFGLSFGVGWVWFGVGWVWFVVFMFFGCGVCLCG